MKAVEQAFQQALACRDAGEYSRALEMLLPLSEDLGDSAAFHAVVAHLHWKQEQPAEAELAFRRSLAITPTHEVAPLGLFHILWRAGDTDAAFDEMRRLLRLRDSDEYRRLLVEINAAE